MGNIRCRFVTTWYRWSDNRGNNNSAKAGLREAFYKYSNDNQELVLGLQSTRSDDYFMINERMVSEDRSVHLVSESDLY